VVRVDRGRALEVVPGVVGEDNIGEAADLGMPATSQWRIGELAIGAPVGCDEGVAAIRIGKRR
jgi:hypothetical protein